MATKRVKSEGQDTKSSWAAHDVSLNNAEFPSIQNDSYRLKMKTTDQGILLWIESRVTKEQWQNTFSDVSKCGAAAIPSEKVFAFLEKALLELHSTVKSQGTYDDATCTIDMERTATGMQLHLVLNMMGLWTPEYSFNLLPVGLEVTDIIQAQLRDAQDEIRALKSKLHRVAISATGDKYLSLTATTGTPSGGHVTWVAPTDMYHICQSHYQLAADFQSVEVFRAGIYVVDVRIANTNSGNGTYLSLLLNETEIARCYQSNPNGYFNTMHIHEVVRLSANATLRVRYSGNSTSHSEPLGNRLTVVMQHDLTELEDSDFDEAAIN